jgi:hypothetical protein
MARDALELADCSLFIDKIKPTFSAADGNLLTRACAFAKERACGLDTPPFQAADLLVDQGTDPPTVACALPAPLLRQDLVALAEIQKKIDPAPAAELKDPSPPSLLRADIRQYWPEDIQFSLASIGSFPRKALLFIAFRLLALENTTDSRAPTVRKTARATPDFYLPVASRLRPAELRRKMKRTGQTLEQIKDPSGIGARYMFDNQPEGLEALGNRSPPGPG